MIRCSHFEIFDKKDLDSFFEYVNSLANTNEQKESAEIIIEYMKGVFDADQRLQKMVSENLSEDLLSCVTLPYKETDDFDEFNFDLINVNNDKIKKREVLIYQNYCDICFGTIPGLYSLTLAYFQQ